MLSKSLSGREGRALYKVLHAEVWCSVSCKIKHIYSNFSYKTQSRVHVRRRRKNEK